MKPTPISRRSKVLNALMDQARRAAILLQAANGEEFVLIKRSDLPFLAMTRTFDIGESDDFEEELIRTRQNAELMAFLDERGAQKNPGTGKTIEEIRRQLEG